MEVSRGVICTWRVVCGERGRGRESCWRCCVGDAEVAAADVGSGGDRARDGPSTDVDMIRGMSEVKYYVLKYIVLYSVMDPPRVTIDQGQPYRSALC